jgi:hypothetical protein
LQDLLDKIIARLMKVLTRASYLVEEQGMTYLALPCGSGRPEQRAWPRQEARWALRRQRDDTP